MKLKTGTILLFNWNSSFFRKLIVFYNKINYGKKIRQWSHAAIVVDERNARDDVLIYEAVAKGFTGPDNWYWRPAIIRDYERGIAAIGRTKLPLKDVKKHADKYLGRPYAWQDLIAIALSLLFKIPIGATGAKNLICSEAVSRILYDASKKKIDFEPEFKKSYDLITPIDMALSKQIIWEMKDV